MTYVRIDRILAYEIEGSIIKSIFDVVVKNRFRDIYDLFKVEDIDILEENNKLSNIESEDIGLLDVDATIKLNQKHKLTKTSEDTVIDEEACKLNDEKNRKKLKDLKKLILKEKLVKRCEIHLIKDVFYGNNNGGVQYYSIVLKMCDNEADFDMFMFKKSYHMC